MSTCINCDHWDLKGSPLRSEGFGHCKVEPNDLLRKAKTTSAQNVCRLDRFKPATQRAIDNRVKALAAQGSAS
ncbi:hypothetical protein [Xenophilus sp. Marseille-Q4582]|uniref:hypothetical protein n=1 Tax=Xenophilus sp. Marseille-Q4582 TaxID=2866600 RepID=UPI001CE4858B|nr:hypothetical protein [Xenophilus sp. Marseille-Q4582]